MATKNRDAELEEALEQGTSTEEDIFADEDPEGFETFDFAAAGETKDGTYHAVVDDAVRGTSQAGNKKYEVKFKLLEIGRTLTGNLSCTPQAAWKTGAALRALGVKPEDDGTIVRFKLQSLIGKPCRVEVVNELYESRMIPKITSVLPPDERTVALLDELV